MRVNNSRFEEQRKKLAQWAKEVSSAFRVERLTALQQSWNEVQERLQTFRRAIEESAGLLRKNLDHLPHKTRSSLTILAMEGWYLDPGLPFPAIHELADALEGDQGEEAHEALCDYYDRELEAIAARLCKDHPHRAAIVSAAFDAHREGKYLLSVPTLLAQADGLGQELIGVHLFSRRDGRRFADRNIGELAAGPLRQAFLLPLALDAPISASRDERQAFPQALNRHAVLHGEALDYGTRVNSCKAISFLAYVSFVLAETRQESA